MIKFLIPLTSILWAAETTNNTGLNADAEPYFPSSPEVLKKMADEQRRRIAEQERRYLLRQTEEYRKNNFGTAVADPNVYEKECRASKRK